MPKFDKILVANDFSGGINNVETPDAILDNECENLVNVEYMGFKFPQTRRGTVRLSNTNALESGRCTSIHDFKRSDGTEDVICTYYDTGNNKQEIRRMSGGIWDSGTGLITPAAPNIAGDIYWQWATFNDIAIGVNGVTTTNNAVMYTGTGIATALSAAVGYAGTIAQGKYIAIYGSRIWIAPHNSFQNTIIASKVGSHTDWDTTATGPADAFIANVGGVKDGDYITGLYPHRGRLIIFKRRSIWVLQPGSTQTSSATNVDLATDKTLYSIRLITKTVGCRSGYTIQAVMNDLIFLSDYGFMQLSVVEESGDFAVKQILSRKIHEIKSSIATDVDTFGSCVDEQYSVYMCSLHVPSFGGSESVNNITYCMDFKDPQNPKWYTWKNGGIGSTLSTVIKDNRKVVYIGQYGYINKLNVAGLTNYHDDDDTIVGGTTEVFYESKIKTKDFTFGSPVQMKLLNYWRLYVELLTGQCSLNIDYIINGELTEQLQRTSELFSLDVSGTLVNPKVVRRFSPRRGTSVQFEIYTDIKDEGFLLRELYMDAFIIDRPRVSRV